MIARRALNTGKLLTLLQRQVSLLGGDEQSRDLFLYLLQLSSVPYFTMLQQWIFKGLVEDPFNEFMVKEHTKISKDNLHKYYNDSYWERRYALVSEHIPSFLAPFQGSCRLTPDTILTTGKYLNVLQQCGTKHFLEGGNGWVDAQKRSSLRPKRRCCLTRP